MPLLHISLRAGKPEAYRQAICDSLYRAMRKTLNVPEGDQFMVVTEHDAGNFRYGNALGTVVTETGHGEPAAHGASGSRKGVGVRVAKQHGERT